MNLLFDPPFFIHFYCFVLLGPWPDQPSGTKVIFPITKALNRRAWSAALESNGSDSVVIVIMPSPNAIIGQYTLKVQLSKGSKAAVYQLGTFVLLFNPWCAGMSKAFQGNFIFFT